MNCYAPISKKPKLAQLPFSIFYNYGGRRRRRRTHSSPAERGDGAKSLGKWYSVKHHMAQLQQAASTATAGHHCLTQSEVEAGKRVSQAWQKWGGGRGGPRRQDDGSAHPGGRAAHGPVRTRRPNGGTAEHGEPALSTARLAGGQTGVGTRGERLRDHERERERMAGITCRQAGVLPTHEATTMNSRQRRNGRSLHIQMRKSVQQRNEQPSPSDSATDGADSIEFGIKPNRIDFNLFRVENYRFEFRFRFRAGTNYFNFNLNLNFDYLLSCQKGWITYSFGGYYGHSKIIIFVLNAKVSPWVVYL